MQDDDADRHLADAAAWPTLRSQRDLRERLCALPDGPRQAVALAFFEGTPHDDIAARLGQDVGTVKRWLRAAVHAMA